MSFWKLSCSWVIFKSLWYDSQNQVQSNSIDVSKGLESLNTFNYIKRISLEPPGSTPDARNAKIMSCCTKQLAMAWLTRHGEFDSTQQTQNFGSSRELTQISSKILNFDLLDPKFNPKTYTLQFMIYTQIIKIHQNKSTTTTTMKFKILTQQFHEVYHTHNFTLNRSTILSFKTIKIHNYHKST